jgi:anti-sigma regulatory factor (Ser/Thr protein kinase)
LNSLDISLRNDPGELIRVAELVQEFARRHGLSSPDLLAVDLSLHEHLTNIIGYGYDDTGEHRIQVRLRLTDRLLQVEVEDDGRPFNPLEREPIDPTIPLDEKPLGGLGIHMMRSAMDRMEYRRTGGRNVLTLWKRVAQT